MSSLSKKASIHIVTVFIVSAIITLFLSSVIIYSRYHRQKKFLIASYTEKADRVKNEIQFELGSIVSDLRTLSQIKSFTQYLDTGSGNLKLEISQIFKVFSKEKKTYDQIRFINSKGLEIIRINYNNGKPAAVNQENLQDKSNRYYFRETFNLDAGDVYFSPFDLNIEHGEIEQPLKPMIRVGIPVFNAAGEKKGILLVNYLGSAVLKILSSIEPADNSDIYLLNPEGYWLYSHDSAKNWAFMYPELKDVSFAKQYPEEWKSIRMQRSGIVSGRENIFIFTTISPFKTPSVQAHYFWKAVIHFPDKAFSALFVNVFKFFSVFMAGIFIITFILVFLITEVVYERRKTQRETAVSLAEKELLLREIHHRVKNSLSLVASFIGMYRSSHPEAENDDLFDALEQKIDAISLVHSYLYQSTDINNIDTKSYFKILLQNMTDNLAASDQKIELVITGDSFFLEAGKIIPLGLILSELAINSLKHAFPGNTNGTIKVEVKREDNGYKITYSDTGAGLPADFSLQENDSLGIVIITSLIDQLKGSITVKRVPETTFTINIPE